MEYTGIPQGGVQTFESDYPYATFVREWALLLPAWSVVVFLLAYWSYIALGIYGTPPLNDLSTITGKNFIS